MVALFAVACGEPLIPANEPGDRFRLADVDGAPVPAQLDTPVGATALWVLEAELLLGPKRQATIAAVLRFDDTTITRTTEHPFLIRADSVVLCEPRLPADAYSIVTHPDWCVVGRYSEEDILVPYVYGAWLQIRHSYHFVRNRP
jgi:hypothetical protein